MKKTSEDYLNKVKILFADISSISEQFIFKRVVNKHSFKCCDNMTTNSITAEDLSRELTEIVLPVTVLHAVEIFFGILGNILIIIVYYKWYKICNFRCFVLSMACIDLLSSVTTLPGEVVTQRSYYSFESVAMCKAKSFFNVLTVWSSALVLFLLAYDRNRKICHPLSWQISNHIAKRLCIGCIIFSIIVSSPTAVFWGIQKYEYVHDNITVHVSICEKSDIYARGDAPFIFILSALVIPTALVMLATAVLNLCTGHKLLTGMGTQSATYGCVSITLHEDDNPHTSSTENMSESDDAIICPTPKRRFSFPTGRHTFRREQLEENENSTPIFRHHLIDIPETALPSFCQIDRLSILHRLRTRPHHTSHCEVDLRVPSRTRQLEQWRRRVLRHKLRTRRRKTMIMITLSTVFIITTTVYLILILFVASHNSILRHLTDAEKVIFFFFLRLYFINALINPVLYGVMDLRFRQGLKRLFCFKRKLYSKKTFV